MPPCVNAAGRGSDVHAWPFQWLAAAPQAQSVPLAWTTGTVPTAMQSVSLVHDTPPGEPMSGTGVVFHTLPFHLVPVPMHHVSLTQDTAACGPTSGSAVTTCHPGARIV